MSDSFFSIIKKWSVEFVPFIFVVALVSYAFGILLELLLPGFLSHVVDLDFLLWAVILLGLLAAFLRRFNA